MRSWTNGAPIAPLLASLDDVARQIEAPGRLTDEQRQTLARQIRAVIEILRGGSVAVSGSLPVPSPAAPPNDQSPEAADPRVQRFVAEPGASLDLTPVAPQLAAWLATAGVRVRVYERLDPDLEERFIQMGRVIATTIERYPFGRVILDVAKRSLNPPPQRARLAFQLRRMAGIAADQIANYLGLPVEVVREFERSGRGLDDADLRRVQAWLGRQAAGRSVADMARLLNVSETDYVRFEETGAGLPPASAAALDAWLAARVQAIGAASYAVAPVRRAAQRYGLTWHEVLTQAASVYAAMVEPLIRAAVLDGVRFSRVGELPFDPGLPSEVWLPTQERIPPGSPDSDVLLHLWAPPDPLVRRFLLGQWMTFAIVGAVRDLAPAGAACELLHDLVIEAPYHDRMVATSFAVLARLGDVILAIDGMTMRHSEHQRVHVRKFHDVVGPLLAQQQRCLVVTLDDPHLHAPLALPYLTVIRLSDLPAAIRRALESSVLDVSSPERCSDQRVADSQ